MRIQHNIAALNSYRQLGSNNNAVSKNLEKLSSGYRINRAGDDAAGLAISEKMRAQITGLETAQKNAEDGISLVQTAEGALTEVHSMLNRMTELATQSANGTYSNEVDRENLQKEVATLKDEIDRISKSTNFNGIKLLDGSLGDASGIDSGIVDNFTSIAIENFGVSGTLVGIDKNDIVTGEFTKGSGPQTGSESFYISNKLEITAGVTTGTTAKKTGGNTMSFEINVGGATIKVTVDSGLQTSGQSTITNSTLNMGALFNKFTGGDAELDVAGTNATFDLDAALGQDGGLDGAGIGEIKVELTQTNADIKELKDIFANFEFSYKQNADSSVTKEVGSGTLKIKAKKQSSADEYKIGGIGNLQATVTKDIEKAFNDIRHDLGSGFENVKFGTSVGDKVAGTEGIKSTYKVSSVEFKVDMRKLNELHGKSLVIDGMTYIFRDIQNLDNPLSQEIEDYVGSATNAKIINYDSSINNLDNKDHVLNKLAEQIQDDSAVDKAMSVTNGAAYTYQKFDVTVRPDGTVRIEESKEFAEDMIMYGNQTTSTIQDIKDKINKIDPSTNTDLRFDEKTTADINIDKDLRAGVWVTINGRSYQFANKADHVEPGKTFVQFTEGDPKANAEALLKAMQQQDPGIFDDSQVVKKPDGSYTIESKNGTPVEITDSGAKGLSLQVGDTSEPYQKVTVKVGKMDTESLGIKDVDISEVEGAEAAIGKLKNAINQVSATRGDLGAVQNRLEHTINNLGVTTENITAAESRIRDTDMAQEMMAYTKNNILVQAAQAMLAQANTVPQGVLQLLG